VKIEIIVKRGVQFLSVLIGIFGIMWIVLGTRMGFDILTSELKSLRIFAVVLFFVFGVFGLHSCYLSLCRFGELAIKRVVGILMVLLYGLFLSTLNGIKIRALSERVSDYVLNFLCVVFLYALYKIIMKLLKKWGRVEQQERVRGQVRGQVRTERVRPPNSSLSD